MSDLNKLAIWLCVVSTVCNLVTLLVWWMDKA